MVKGCERRVVHLKNTDSALFEEAFFLLKDEKNEKMFAKTIDTLVEDCYN